MIYRFTFVLLLSSVKIYILYISLIQKNLIQFYRYSNSQSTYGYCNDFAYRAPDCCQQWKHKLICFDLVYTIRPRLIHLLIINLKKNLILSLAMVYIHFPSTLTEEELMLQAKYQKLKKKVHSISRISHPKHPIDPTLPSSTTPT